MSKRSRIVVSIFAISLIVLPALFILCYMFPMFLYNVLTLYFGVSEDVLTWIGVSVLVIFLIPPWDKQKRAVVASTFRLMSKRFFRQRPIDETIFHDQITHFAQVTIPANKSHADPATTIKVFQPSSYNILEKDNGFYLKIISDLSPPTSQKMRSSSRYHIGDRFSFFSSKISQILCKYRSLDRVRLSFWTSLFFKNLFMRLFFNFWGDNGMAPSWCLRGFQYTNKSIMQIGEING
ncbi:MAG: hypothetical protein EU536_02445 [Promethearchaeota archaeon]|nr:MAG: hypothetical protein EU536_02445 [Candidatus Lokiarchaeota archaeon]